MIQEKTIKGSRINISRKNKQSDNDKKLWKGTIKTKNAILWAYEHEPVNMMEFIFKHLLRTWTKYAKTISYHIGQNLY
jgi:hypothetical protein